MKMTAARSLLRASTLVAWTSIPLVAVAQTPSSAVSADDAMYTLGLNLGLQLRQNGVAAPVPMSRIEQGVKDALAGKKPQAADQTRLQAYLRGSAESAAVRNAAAASEFLARNAHATGVITRPSGLEYKVLEAGDADAPSPRPTDQVTVNFRGTLLDGTEFGSSATPGTVSTVQVNGVNKAWTEALSLMKPGARWLLFVPPELGYGAAWRPGIPGGSLLIYDLRLITAAPGLLETRPTEPAMH